MTRRCTWPGRAHMLVFAALLLTSLGTGRAQGPPLDGFPGNSDRRASDPCDRAVVPHGQSIGLQAQCSPVGGGGAAKGDFNGDGIGDLVIGSPGEDVGSVADAGAVHVIYGTANGLASPNNRLLHQNVSGVNGTATTGDNFGWSLAAGDFNGDGYSDLAIGVPNEDIGGFVDVGAVQVFYGAANGLKIDSSQQFWDYQDMPDTLEVAALAGTRNQWGYSLVWADFDGDGGGDLGIGIPNVVGEPHSILNSSRVFGAVLVLYGDFQGLAIDDVEEVLFRSRDTSSVGGGWVLSAGDYNGDGFGDLAAGVPMEDSTRCEDPFCVVETWIEESGIVEIYSGSAAGLPDHFSRLLSQEALGSNETRDRFGSALASGDFNGDGFDDLAVGVPREDLVNNSQVDAGNIHVLYGPDLRLSEGQTITQNTFAGYSPQTGDKFGVGLAAADFNGDGRDDLAMGVPGEDVNGFANAGVVHVMYGANNRLSTTDTETWHQAVSGILNSAEEGDQFGFVLTAWNFGRTSHADLAIGIPFEDVFDQEFEVAVDAGAVHVIYGSAAGLSASGNQLWTANNVSGDGAEAYDNFGRSVY